MSARHVIRNLSIGDLIQYRLPVPGVLSILHRLSGALMFLLLPFTLWLLDLSLGSQASYQQLREAADGWFARLLLSLLAWSLLHHLAAGVRFLLLDLDLGVDRAPARRSAWIVFAVSIPLALWAALGIFGAL
ncbi:MAG TPA: succinate dehydrogenase, cytochrome b556 subunit [Burkholderiaceae bacterium]|jgi:succinate dehydrogenase / fumarate reductase cytochrome b subunit|nr:succinate dehydrogenase, cytochrome b556 subunit [Burkholderiaceae bacterium]